MKTRAFLVLSAIASLALLWSCVSTSPDATTEIKDQFGIVIPATPFTEADQTDMNAILANYDKGLYRIDTYVDGQFQKRHGTLRDIYTDKTLAASINGNLMKQGFTRSALRVGEYPEVLEGGAANPQKIAKRSPTPRGDGKDSSNGQGGPKPGGGPQPQKIQQDKLIKELEPILAKYNKKSR